MEQRNRIFYLILSFLPILIYPVNILYAMVAVVVITGFGLYAVKDEKTFKDMLHPLVLVFAACVAYYALNFAFGTITGIMGIFRAFRVTFVLNYILNILNLLIFIALIAGVVLIALGIKNNKKVFVVGTLVDIILTGTIPCRKQAQNAKAKAKKKEEEPEIVVEDESDNK